MSSRGKYGKWTTEDLSSAIFAFRNGSYGLNECARLFKVPKARLKRHLEEKNKRTNYSIKKMGRFSVFNEEVEAELARHILIFEERIFGMGIRDVRKLAFELATRNNLKHNFNTDKRMAGKKWYYGFMSRHKEISLRQPEKTSMARAAGFSKVQVNKFYELFKKICEEDKLTATRIFNVDETGCSTVQRQCQKILAKKGKHQIGSISSGERGANTTVVCCASAAGQFVPPMIIFKRKRFQEELSLGAPPGSIVTIGDTGYISSDLFVTWLKLAATVRNAQNAFRASGIWPIDENVLKESDFAASMMFDSASNSNHESQQETSSSEEDNIPLAQVVRSQGLRTKRAASTSLNISVQDISPLPIKKSKSSKVCRTQDAVELTSSPYKNELEARTIVKYASLNQSKK